MNKQVFYTIQRGDNTFISENLFEYNASHIINTIKFKTLKDAEEYKKDLRKDKVFKIIEVTCNFKNMEDK
ncbi:hypothetical protein ACTQ4P_12040 [Clostridium sporogenes]|uniref:hypothetical protein n=1 Tax=Clostridium sporogenes TaxID=1509 RepID=UPI0029012940|nr:hypothetical protein [Clostridium botulinum]